MNDIEMHCPRIKMKTTINTQTSKDCGTVVLRTQTIQGVCVCYIQFARYTDIVCSYVESKSVGR